MKNQKNLNRSHKNLLKSRRLNPNHWYYYKDLTDELHIIHKVSGATRTVKK